MGKTPTTFHHPSPPNPISSPSKFFRSMKVDQSSKACCSNWRILRHLLQRQPELVNAQDFSQWSQWRNEFLWIIFIFYILLHSLNRLERFKWNFKQLWRHIISYPWNLSKLLKQHSRLWYLWRIKWVAIFCTTPWATPMEKNSGRFCFSIAETWHRHAKLEHQWIESWRGFPHRLLLTAWPECSIAAKVLSRQSLLYSM